MVPNAHRNDRRMLALVPNPIPKNVFFNTLTQENPPSLVKSGVDHSTNYN